MKAKLLAIQSSVGGFIGSKLTSWSWWKSILKFYFWMFCSVAFSMFIVEEACQVIGFGRYTLLSGKMYEEAAEACNYSAKFLATSRKIIRIGGVINPMSGYVFGRYMDAEEKKLSWEMKRIEKELKKQGKRITTIENELRIRPIAPELITVSARGRPVGPEMPPKSKLYPTRQIDYTTQAERLTEQAGMVFTTNSGEKYHKLFCRWLRKPSTNDGELKSNIKRISRQDATTEGLEPCGTCKPR